MKILIHRSVYGLVDEFFYCKWIAEKGKRFCSVRKHLLIPWRMKLWSVKPGRDERHRKVCWKHWAGKAAESAEDQRNFKRDQEDGYE